MLRLVALGAARAVSSTHKAQAYQVAKRAFSAEVRRGERERERKREREREEESERATKRCARCAATRARFFPRFRSHTQPTPRGPTDHPKTTTQHKGGGGGGGGGGFGKVLLLAGLAGGGYYFYSNDGFKGVASFAAAAGGGAGAQIGDYAAVRKAIEDVLDSDDYDDGSYGPVLVRLAWHASGTATPDGKGGYAYGSNGATMRFAPESEHGANAGLAVARGLLEPIKRKFPWISHGDLWTLAGVVAIESMGGPTIPWQPGRVDAADSSSCPPDGKLPDASLGAPHLRDVFGRMGFDDREIVALSGAHTLGRCHPDRSGFSGPWTNAPTTFSNLYFQELTNNAWRKKKWSGPLQYEDKSGQLMMLPTDMALLWDKGFKKHVVEYAKDEELFFRDFARAFSRLLALGVPGSSPPS